MHLSVRALALVVPAVASCGCPQRESRDPAAAQPTVTVAAGVAAASSSTAPQALADPWPAWEPGAAWRMLRWGMTPSQVQEALGKAGLRFDSHLWGKSPGGYIIIRSGPWEATIYFQEGTGPLSQVLIQGSLLTRESASEARKRVSDRLSAHSEEQTSEEHLWRKDNSTFLRVLLHRYQGQSSVVEEWNRSSPLNWGLLPWGAPPQQVQKILQDGGYSCKQEEVFINPCEMPNPPPDCAKPEPSLAFAKAGQNATASFVGGKLVQVSIRTPVADRAQGQARIREVRAIAGEPFRSTDTVIWRWVNASTHAQVQLDHILPEDSWSLSENYGPAK